jgi:hypothetical protein
MFKIMVLVSFLIPSLAVLGCGSGDSRPTTGDDGSGHGASYTCGTEQEPATFVLKDVKPAAGDVVPNRSIVHQFTIVDPPFMLSSFTLFLLPKHTAGTFSPSALQLTGTAQGKDLSYSATIDAWATAPGHVEIKLNQLMRNSNDCVFQFPSPVFSYDVTAP